MSATTQPERWAAGALAPRPGQAPLRRMLAAQTVAELKLVLRNGEQVLLNLVIPVGLLAVVTLLPFVSVAGADTRAERAGFFVPGVLALAVMSSAFTGQAIGVGFERQYGVLKRLGATPLPRSVLLLAKTLGVLAVQVLQLVAHRARRPGARLGPAAATSGACCCSSPSATAAFSGLGLLLGRDAARADQPGGRQPGVAGAARPRRRHVPDRRVRAGRAGACRCCRPPRSPTGSASVLADGTAAPLRDVLALAAWGVAGLSAAARFFRWE